MGGLHGRLFIFRNTEVFFFEFLHSLGIFNRPFFKEPSHPFMRRISVLAVRPNQNIPFFGLSKSIGKGSAVNL